MVFSLVNDPQNPDAYIRGVVSMVFFILPWPFILIRIYVRLFLVRSWGWDDTFMMIAQLIFAPFCMLNYLLSRQIPGAQAHSKGTAVLALNVSDIMSLMNFHINSA
jgi:hypothetical protein